MSSSSDTVDSLSLFPVKELPEPALWPLSSGAVIAASVLCLLLLGLAFWGWRRYQRHQALRPYREAKALLAQLAEQPESLSQWQALAIWQRRVALAMAGREAVAAQQGTEWVAQLGVLAQRPELAERVAPVLCELRFQSPERYRADPERYQAGLALSQALLSAFKRQCCQHV